MYLNITKISKECAIKKLNKLVHPGGSPGGKHQGGTVGASDI